MVHEIVVDFDQPFGEEFDHSGSIMTWQTEGECAGVEFPPDYSTLVSIGCCKIVPQAWVRNRSVRLPANLVEADDASCGGMLHVFGNVAVHVVINMMVITGCTAVTVGVEDSFVLRVSNGDSKGGSLLWGCWGFENHWQEVWSRPINDVLLVPQMLGQLLACSGDRLPVRWARVVTERQSRAYRERLVGD